MTAAYGRQYNTDRPHSGLGNQTPEEFARGWVAAAPLPLTPQGEREGKTKSGVDNQGKAAILMPVGLS